MPNIEVQSPCIAVCSLQQGYCYGCWRTIEEIARWPRMNDAEKRGVLAALGGRKMRVTAASI